MAIPLVAHEALSTAYINDVDGLGVFAQQLFGFGRKGDVFLGISTSGNSKNIMNATVVARALEIPVIGHCLGSQLLATALGAEVTRNARPEIGWSRIAAADSALARDWFGAWAGRDLLTFQWHGDTFAIPPGAERIASSVHCANQAFVARGLHLGIQSHLEMTPELVRLSVERNGRQMDRQQAAGNPACSPRAEVLEDLPARTGELRETLLQLYRRWARGLQS